MMMQRRSLLLAGAALLACCSKNGPAEAARPVSVGKNEDRFADSPFRKLSEEDWRARLSPRAFSVLRKEGTEPPYSSPLEKEKRAGVFVCAGCALPLFKSEWKFESGTGWPSFYTVIAENIGTKPDVLLFTPRTEYHCARCLGHQGHVFEDGPRPTGLRYCNNGVALDFIPA